MSKPSKTRRILRSLMVAVIGGAIALGGVFVVQSRSGGASDTGSQTSTPTTVAAPKVGWLAAVPYCILFLRWTEAQRSMHRNRTGRRLPPPLVVVVADPRLSERVRHHDRRRRSRAVRESRHSTDGNGVERCAAARVSRSRTARRFRSSFKRAPWPTSTRPGRRRGRRSTRPERRPRPSHWCRR